MNILESVQQSGSKVQVLWIALPLAAALLLPGCPLYMDNGRALACTTNSDCPTGQTCVGGSCQPTVGPTCTTDAMCDSMHHCDEHTSACVPGQRVCETHGDCDVSFMCDVRACVASTTCSADADCHMAGQWCDYRGTCVPHGTGDCRTATDCTGGDLCVEGSCTHLPATCQFQYDCPAGTACVNAECTAVCMTSNDCVAGDICSTSRFCQSAPGECTTTAMCASGQHCVGGRCLEDCHTAGTTCPSASRESSYCAGDMFCHPSWQPAVACNTNSDCASGRHCLAHVCRTPCPAGMTSSTAGDAQCGTIDSTLPFCRLDTASSEYLCNASMSTTASCRTSADCSGTQNCVNAACQ